MVVVSSVAPCLLHHLPSKFDSPYRRAIIYNFAVGPQSLFAHHYQLGMVQAWVAKQLVNITFYKFFLNPIQ